MKRIIYLLMPVIFVSCCQTNTQDNIISNKAKQLNDSAILVSNTNITESIGLLDEAIDMQPNYYLAYWNKLIFQNQLGLKDEAFKTLKDLEKINPQKPDLKTIIGIFYEQNYADLKRATIKYQEANLIYNSILDTISSEAKSYQSVLMDYAINLKLLGKEKEANEILHSIIRDSKEEYLKEYIDTSFIQKTRKEILDSFYSQLSVVCKI